MPASSRKYPFIGFNMDRELGKDVLKVNGISKTVDGVKLLNNVSFTLSRTDKVAFIGESEQAITMLFKILAEEEEPDEGSIKWGVSTSRSYFPIDNSAYFNDNDESIVDWIRKYSTSEVTDTYLRGYGAKKRDSFASQTFCGVAEYEGETVGMYILHPNNVGRCGHIANASYAVKSTCRGKGAGKVIVEHCLFIAKQKGFKVLQFNAVVASTKRASLRISFFSTTLFD